MKTNEMTIEQRLDFIASLELPEVSADMEAVERAPVSEGKPSAVIDASELITFEEGLPEQHRKDVENSCCLAQLAANKKYDRERDVENWYKYYVEVLQNIGWMTTAFHFTKYDAKTSSFSFDLILLNLLSTICSPTALALISRAIEAYRKLAESDFKVRLFESQSHSAQSGNFQVGNARNESGDVALTNEAAYFSSEVHVTRLFFTKFSSSQTKLYTSDMRFVLSEDIYAQVREQVIKKLGRHAKEFIADLEI
jgi:hypothetical protein